MINQFKALADETRLRIISVLLLSDLCVCEIEEYLGLTQSNASKHLRILRDTRILDSYKKAQWVYYKISDEFKNNKSLYEYIIENVKNLPTYQKDRKNYENYRGIDLCNRMSNHEGNTNEKS